MKEKNVERQILALEVMNFTLTEILKQLIEIRLLLAKERYNRKDARY